MNCPKCAASVPEDAHFCEDCGARIQAAPILEKTPPSQPHDPTVAARDHFETVLTANVAAVTDRGIRHTINEDSFSIAHIEQDGKSWFVIVVCDGVSSAILSEAASLSAAQTAQKVMIGALQQGDEPESALQQAIAAAHNAVCTLSYSRSLLASLQKSPPATTIIAAIVTDETAIIGWVGDSRTYWLSGSPHAFDDSKLLTHDHSWVNDMVDSGQLTLEAASHSPNAHAITQCLGPMEPNDPGPPPEPDFVTFSIPGSPGILLLCTDGLWNYADDPAQLSELAYAASERPTESEGTVADVVLVAPALQIARSLVQFAVEQGGRDNITTAVVSFSIEK